MSTNKADQLLFAMLIVALNKCINVLHTCMKITTIIGYNIQFQLIIIVLNIFVSFLLNLACGFV